MLEIKINMDKCLICGSTNFTEENVNEIYDINGEPVLVGNIFFCQLF